MVNLIAAFGAGVVVSAVVFFFVWKNNKKWFAEVEPKVDEILAAVQSGKFTADIKAKIEGLLTELKAKK